MSALPGISVLMPTYARTRVLGEAIHGFLQQTYAGPKELVVFNDRVDQHLLCDAPGVKIVNFSTKYSTLGAKRNALVSVAKHPFVCHWDDDDIYLPERLTRGMQLYRERARQGFRVSRESHCFQTDDNASLMLRDSGQIWCALFEKQALHDVGGSRDMDMYEDMDLLHRMLAKRWVYGESNTPGMPSFIYRRGGTPYFHMTDMEGFNHKDVERTNGNMREFVKKRVEEMIASGEEPTGTIRIEPAWAKDYVAMAAATWAQREAA